MKTSKQRLIIKPRANKLNLNVKKTELVIFRPRKLENRPQLQVQIRWSVLDGTNKQGSRLVDKNETPPIYRHAKQAAN